MLAPVTLERREFFMKSYQVRKEHLNSAIRPLIKAGGGEDGLGTAHRSEEAGGCMACSGTGSDECSATRILPTEGFSRLFRSLYKITLKGQGLGPPSNSAGNKDSATESLQLRSFSPHSGHSGLSP